MARTLLLSDVHLSPDLPLCSSGLKALLNSLPDDCERVVLLGDIFEVWVGDDFRSDYLDDIESCFKSVSARGVELWFCHGNRDFMVDAGPQGVEPFCQRIGARKMAEAEVVDFYGHAALLMHGDQLCTLDTAYMAFREQSRNSDWQQAMLQQPLSQREQIAQFMRLKSQIGNSNKADNIMDVTPDEVLRVLEAQPVQYLIHGHTHRPARHSLKLADGRQVERIVLGDWRETEGCAIVAWADADGIKLQEWQFS